MPAIRLMLGLSLSSVMLAPACAGEHTEQEAVQEQRIIENRLDTTQSRVLRDSARPLGSSDLSLGSMNRPLPDAAPPPGNSLGSSQVTRDLGAAEQRLRSFKTLDPNAPSTPLLERKLDRLSRPTNLRGP